MTETGDKKLEKKAYLIVNSQVFPLTKEVTTIGRKLDNDLVIQDILVSRKHAEIRFQESKYFIYDLDSTGGTYLNNKKISEAKLFSGDLILISNIPLMFIDESKSLEIDSSKSTGELGDGEDNDNDEDDSDPEEVDEGE
jgi:pSer/pThr/pTyr-binding forkhead associated (FHA) protein